MKYIYITSSYFGTIQLYDVCHIILYTNTKKTKLQNET